MSLADDLRSCDPHDTDQVIKTLNAGAHEIERVSTLLHSAQRNLIQFAETLRSASYPEERAHLAQSLRVLAANLPVRPPVDGLPHCATCRCDLTVDPVI